MVDYVNSTGGLAGCKITLDWYNWSSTSGTGDGESQNECTQLAEDDHDFALIPQLFETPVFVQCAASHGVPVILNDTTANLYPGPADFARYPGYLYAPDYVSWDQLGGEIGQLAQLGFFSSGAKVAILVADDGSGVQPTLVNNYWKPALAKLGIVPVVFTYHHEASVNNVSNEETAWSSATLQFKQAGVNRVLFTPDGGDASNFYTTTASSQHFYPRYGLNSYNGPPIWSGVPADQQAGAVDVSFQLTDLWGNTDADRLTAARSNPAQPICDKVYKGKTGSFPVVFAYQWCDALLFLQEALKGAASVSAQTLRAGVERLGTSQPLAGVYGSPNFGPARHYGASNVQLMTFNTSTKNWQYAGSPVPAS